MRNFWKWLYVAGLLGFLGCTPLSCTSASKSTPKNQILTIPEITLHIKLRGVDLPIIGAAGVASIGSNGRNYHIHMYGESRGDTITISPLILGHEILHILHWEYSSIIPNPDGD